MGGGGGKGFFKGTLGSSRFSGELVKVNNPDSNADKLAKRIDGKSRVAFANDPDRKEFDVVSKKYIAETKPALKTLNPKVRKQMKATFEAARQTGKKVYYHFDGQPAQVAIDKLQEYSRRYGIEVIIDTKPFKK